jgi:DNA-directed RNA polymerase specialized sigma24 family protein
MALMAKMERPPEISLDDLASQGGEPMIEIEIADNAKLEVSRLIEGLNAEDREILRLKAEGNTYPEIGKKLGISSTAANSRWRRLQERIERERKVQATRSGLRAASAE